MPFRFIITNIIIIVTCYTIIAALLLSFADCQDGEDRLVEAIWKSDYPAVSRRLEDGVDPQPFLYVAVRAHKTPIVRLLIQHGAEVSAEDEYGNTALYYAAISGNFPMTELLLENGADPNTANSKQCSRSILQSCVNANSGSRCNGLILQALILAGGQLDSVDCNGVSLGEMIAHNCNKEFAMVFERFKALPSTDCEEANGKKSNLLVQAIISNNAGKVAQLLEIENVDPELEEANTHLTGLFYAVVLGNYNIVRELLEHDANPRRIDEAGYSVLHYAIRKGQLSIVQQLLDHGADLNSRNHVDCGQTPLITCARGSSILENKCGSSLAQLLLNEGAHVDTYDCTGATAQKKAVIARNLPVLQAINEQIARTRNASFAGNLTRRPDSNDMEAKQVQSFGLNPSINERNANDDLVQYTNEDLFEALKNGRIWTLQAILSSHQVNIENAFDNGTMLNPLMYTIMAGGRNRAAVVRMLLANTNQTLNGTLHAAIGTARSAPVVYLLLQSGADPNDFEPSAVSGECETTPLIECVLNVNTCDDAIVRALLKYGASTTLQNCQNLTAYDLALRRNANENIVRSLGNDTVTESPHSFQRQSYIVHALRQMYSYQPHDVNTTFLEPNGIRFEYTRDDQRVVQVILQIFQQTQSGKRNFHNIVMNAGNDPEAPLVHVERNFQIGQGQTFHYQLAAVFEDGQKFAIGNLSRIYRSSEAAELKCGYIGFDGSENATANPLPWNANGSADVYNCNAVLIGQRSLLASYYCFVGKQDDLLVADSIQATLTNNFSASVRLKELNESLGIAFLETAENNVSLYDSSNYGVISPVCLPTQSECDNTLEAARIIRCYIGGLTQTSLIQDIIGSHYRNDDEMCAAIQQDVASNSLVCSLEESLDETMNGGEQIRDILDRVAKCFKDEKASLPSHRAFNEICPALDWINSLL